MYSFDIFIINVKIISLKKIGGEVKILNKVILIGRLGQDPSLRYTQNGTAVVNFDLAVERPFTNQEGENDVDFIKIVAWKKQAESCAKHLEKGRLVAVEGRLQIRRYEDKNGNNRKVSEIIARNVKFLDWGNSSSDDDSPTGDQYAEDDIDVPF